MRSAKTKQAMARGVAKTGRAEALCDAPPGAVWRGSNRSGWLRWRRVCEILTADPPREQAWRTVSTPLYPDSTEWRILVQPAGPGTRIAESFQVVRLPPAWLDRLMALVNPSHIDRAAALENDLRRLD